MADLNDRGQIILISAFILAVTFVALALVVNSAIFTENLASRGEVSGSSEALVYQHQIEQSVGEAMAFANVYNTSGLSGSVKASISDIGTRGGIQQAREGQLVNVSFADRTFGKRIADNVSGGSNFNSDGNAGDWQLAEDVQKTRNFKIQDISGLSSSKSTAFTVLANESDTNDDIWKLWIYHDGELVVEVETPDDTGECRFSTGVSGNDIDVSRGIVNGERCHALTRSGTGGTEMWFASGIPGGNTYNITFENGNNIDGNYSMVIRGSGNPEFDSNLESGPNPGDPYYTDALYQTTVHYIYVTPNVAYETDVRIAPGEPPS